MKSYIVLTLALLAMPAMAQTAPVELTAPGPEGPLAGTLIDPDAKAPLVVILPGSGPTDRDGNNRLGVTGGPYRQLAEALAVKGVATLRADKRGLFASKAAQADGNAVTTANYADDAHAWANVLTKRSGRKCVWLLGIAKAGWSPWSRRRNRRGFADWCCCPPPAGRSAK